MTHRGLAVALAASLLAGPATAHGSPHGRSACQRLKAQHDLAPAKKVKLVERRNEDGGLDLRGCVLPRGKVITVASSSDFYTSSSSFTVRQVAGHHVLVDSRSRGRRGGYDDTYVVDIKRRRSYTIASFCREGTATYCSGTPGEPAPKEAVLEAFINPGGQAVALIQQQDNNDVLRGFGADGKLTLLDFGRPGEISASSLRLHGHLATWTHSGEPRSARLGRSKCQTLKAKHDLAPAKKVKLVRRRMSDETFLFGCVLPRGGVRLVAATNFGYVSRFRLWQVAGHHVLVGTYDANQVFDRRRTYVYDIKRDQEYTIAESCGPPDGDCGTQETAEAAFVNAAGQAAAVVHGVYSGEVLVLGFTSNGARIALDSGTKAEIPASSLALDDHEVTWTHSGVQKHATLSG
jgi:hypothetical protein